MSELAYSKRIDNLELRIYTDDDAESPRQWDNVGAIWADGTHRRYNFHEPIADEILERIKAAHPVPDDIPTEDEAGNEWEAYDYLNYYAVAPGIGTDYMILPVYMYDHSGLSFSTGSFSCSWDSGMIGWIMVDKVRWDELHGGEWNAEVVEKCLDDEIETLDNYHVYGAYYFELVEYTGCDCCGHEDEETLDSCGGFYGPVDGDFGAKASILEHLDAKAKPLAEDWN